MAIIPPAHRRPIYLLPDSRLLFSERLFCAPVRALIGSTEARAAYIGAANGDAVEFYEIFVAAMAHLGVRHCHMISKDSWPHTRPQLEQADIILLAGGDLERGWKAIAATGMKDVIVSRYQQGALLIGVSAGAMLLGRHGLLVREEANAELIGSLQLVPFIVDVRREASWQELTSAITLLEGAVQGLGIPAEGAALYHPDDEIEAIGAVHLFSMNAGELERAVILPREQ